MKIILRVAAAVWFVGFLRMGAAFHSYNKRVGGRLSFSEEVVQIVFCLLWPITKDAVNPEVTKRGVRKEGKRAPARQYQVIQEDC